MLLIAWEGMDVQCHINLLRELSGSGAEGGFARSSPDAEAETGEDDEDGRDQKPTD